MPRSRLSISRTQAVVATIAAFGLGAAALPPLADAAGIGLVRLVDGTSKRKAQITPQGRLRVDPAPPGAFSRSISMLAGTTARVVPTVPAGKQIRLTSITVADDPFLVGPSQVLIKPSDGCQPFGEGIFWMGTTAHAETVHAVFPTPLIINDPCALLWNPGNSTTVTVTITGYFG